MILVKKEHKFYKVLALESYELKDKVWGDCSIKEGEWYEALIEDNNDDLYLFIKFGNALCVYAKRYFKSESDIREEKIKNVLEQNDEEYCYYSDLPSPMSYMKKD